MAPAEEVQLKPLHSQVKALENDHATSRIGMPIVMSEGAMLHEGVARMGRKRGATGDASEAGPEAGAAR